MERMAAITGRYYELEATQALVQLLRLGDWFLDVGANIGFLTLTAVRLVGPTGRVIAVEPNPRLVKRLREAIQRNAIDTVDIVPNALGSRKEIRRLSFGSHHGVGSLINAAGDESAEVEVQRAEDILANVPSSVRCLVKIDVEGFELEVLKGFGDKLARANTAFLVEITDTWLRAAGGTADELFLLMSRAGYSAIALRVGPFGNLRLEPCEPSHRRSNQFDVLFVKAPDSWLSELAR
jgi:FkbM family methyltransferase